jgi:serine/threonine protein kinase
MSRDLPAETAISCYHPLPMAVASALKGCPVCGRVAPADSVFCEFDGTRLASSFEAAPTSTAETRSSIDLLGQAALAPVAGAFPATSQPTNEFDADSDEALGRVLADQVRLDAVIGAGAMGKVYRGFQLGVEREVAVKVLHPALATTPAIVERFLREAKLASRLVHPHIVQVFLSGKTSQGDYYMVMELLAGSTLQHALNSSSGFSIARALHITSQLCHALGEAHDLGIVHRDLKPENIMLVPRKGDPDFLKVLDFGIARAVWGTPAMSTATGQIFGTAKYLSPEGAQGEHVGPESDVYALSTLLYQMLAARTPFEGDQAVDVLIQQINEPPPHLASVAPHVPMPLASVVMANLAKARADRAKDARAFLEQIEVACSQAGLVLAGASASISPVSEVSIQRPVTELATPLEIVPIPKGTLPLDNRVARPDFLAQTIDADCNPLVASALHSSLSPRVGASAEETPRPLSMVQDLSRLETTVPRQTLSSMQRSPSTTLEPTPARRSSALVLLVCTVVLLCAGVGGWTLLTYRQPKASESGGGATTRATPEVSSSVAISVSAPAHGDARGDRERNDIAKQDGTKVADLPGLPSSRDGKKVTGLDSRPGAGSGSNKPIAAETKPPGRTRNDNRGSGLAGPDLDSNQGSGGSGLGGSVPSSKTPQPPPSSTSVKWM